MNAATPLPTPAEIDGDLKAAIRLGTLSNQWDKEHGLGYHLVTVGLILSLGTIGLVMALGRTNPYKGGADFYMSRYLRSTGHKSLFDKIDDFIFGKAARAITGRINSTAEHRPGPRVQPPFNPQPAPAG